MNNESSSRNYDNYLRQETGEIEIYRRLLSSFDYVNSKNLNSNVTVSDFAKMLFTVNSSIDDINDSLSNDIIPSEIPFSYAHSHVVLTILTVAYVSIFIAGVLGNVVTCIVIAKNKTMHTAVNYYLFSLAISDLCLLLCALPDEVYMLWYPEYPFNEYICKLHKFAAESFTNATVFTITAFTIERYVAICKPFLSHTLSKLSRAYKFILFIWVISMCLAVPQTLFTLHLDETYKICIPKAEHVHFFVVSTFLLFVIPMSIITILYVLIGLQLRKSKIVQRGAVNGSSVRLKRKILKIPTKHQTLVTMNCESHYNEALINQQQQAQHRPNDINKNYKNNLSEQDSIIPEDGRINYSNNRTQVHHGSRHVLRMLVVVVIAFFICWLPFHSQRLIFSYIAPGVFSDNQSFVVNSLSGILFFTSTCINPFLYNLMSHKFREAFKVTISKYFYTNNHEKFQSPNSRKLFRTTSQRSCSMNSTSMNTCSSVCSMQPFNNQNQQMTFRYFDSKRPLVVSFRRVNKMTQNNFTLEHCNSINDFHRIDTSCGSSYGLNSIKSVKENGQKTLISKYCLNGNNVSRNGIIRSSNEIQPCRNFNYIDKQRAHFEVQYDEDEDDEIYRSDKDRVTITYPKEKFYGNAKLMCGVNNDEVLRTKTLSEQNDNSLIFNHKLLRGRLLMNRHNKSLVNGSQVNLNEINDGNKTLLQFNLAKVLNSRNDVVYESRVNRKCSSTPSLYKISHFPGSLDMDCRKEREQGENYGNNNKDNFVSILSLKRKEAFCVKTSKSC